MPDAAQIDLFEMTPDPAILIGADGVSLRANAAFRAAFPHAAHGGRPPWGRVAPPAFLDGARTFEAAAPNGRRYEWRERLLGDGARIAVARDVTERVEACEQAARAKTMLFATLTHELRTPLNGVLGMAEILSQTQRASPEREYLQAIRRSGEHLLTLITDILDYARLDAETFVLEERQFEPEEMAQSVAELLSPRAREKGLEICVRVAPATPARVAADERRLRQVLFNLVGNAVKFTEKGGVSVEVSMAGAGRLRFVVRDTGPGIPAEMQHQIFEEFVQGDSSPARPHGGAGLGLAIVRKLARKLGGDSGLTSAPGAGASFWVEAPVAVVEAARPRSAPLAGLRAAIMTPHAMLAEALAATIRESGGEAYVVRRQADAEAAGKPDIVLLDHAPEMQTLSRGAAPTIVLVPQEDRAVLEGYRSAGVTHYLVKPVRRASLIARMLAAARGEPTPAAVSAGPAPPERARVLLAEDDPLNALIARTMLERCGCDVHVVENGAAALEAMRTLAFDLAFLDLRMPKLDGRAAARQIRALPPPAGATPLIALTADAGEAERAEAIAAGMNDFLTKPIEPKRLQDVLARFTAAANEAKFAAS